MQVDPDAATLSSPQVNSAASPDAYSNSLAVRHEGPRQRGPYRVELAIGGAESGDWAYEVGTFTISAPEAHVLNAGKYVSGS